MANITDIIQAMIVYYKGDARRINHFIKVYSYAKVIGAKEINNEKMMEVLEIAAITHDIGIKNSELKYNSSSGKYQEIEGPDEARKMLEKLEVKEEIIERVCWLIAHHHTYTGIESLDHQILVEADFIVNAYEDMLEVKSIQSFENKIFKTKTGKSILESLYLSNKETTTEEV